jgi:ABC-type transport system involved in multi-copper enzyme maturation permease subunit
MSLLLVGILLMLVQYVAAVPWLLVWSRQMRATPGATGPVRTVELRPPLVLLAGLGVAVVAGVALGLVLGEFESGDSATVLGKLYGSLLQLQLQVDLLVLLFVALGWVWPKGTAVARAAFREGYRQPMFWLLLGLAVILLVVATVLPYWTFGEDYIMVKEMGFDTIMLAAAAFGVIAAAMSISEEIEGRTAVTLMSKPVSRRQFLLGKFAGIFLCCLLLILGLGWIFDHTLLLKRWLDKMEPVVLPPSITARIDQLDVPSGAQNLLRGLTSWIQHTSEVLPGLAMSASLVMILVAVAVTLATRLPMIVNLVICLVVFFLSNLAPILVLSTLPRDQAKLGPVQRLLHFTAQGFDTLLPNLELFRVRPTLIDETTLPMRDYLHHVGAVTVYGFLFTGIVLLLGLVLFEDRDLG